MSHNPEKPVLTIIKGELTSEVIAGRERMANDEIDDAIALASPEVMGRVLDALDQGLERCKQAESDPDFDKVFYPNPERSE